MQDRITEVHTALNRAKLPFGARKAHPMTLDTYEFMLDKKDYNVYWDVRKGLIPIVGGARETGERKLHRLCMEVLPCIQCAGQLTSLRSESVLNPCSVSVHVSRWLRSLSLCLWYLSTSSFRVCHCRHIHAD